MGLLAQVPALLPMLAEASWAAPVPVAAEAPAAGSRVARPMTRTTTAAPVARRRSRMTFTVLLWGNLRTLRAPPWSGGARVRSLNGVRIGCVSRN
ncbi:hypothetical protein GCM10009738_24320 [Kitasatospora viridis]